jgi:hypothetical protein
MSMIPGGPRREREGSKSLSPERGREAGGGRATHVRTTAVVHKDAFVVTGGGQRGGSMSMVPGGPRREREGSKSLSPERGRKPGEDEVGPWMGIGDFDKTADVQVSCVLGGFVQPVREAREPHARTRLVFFF